jgi:hypothetical protein
MPHDPAYPFLMGFLIPLAMLRTLTSLLSQRERKEARGSVSVARFAGFEFFNAESSQH